MMKSQRKGWLKRLLPGGAPLSMLLTAGALHAAPAGLPFAEDFRSTSLHDDVRSTAHWSTAGVAIHAGDWTAEVRSRKINLRAVVPRTLLLTANVHEPESTVIVWELTNNGGATWHRVTPGQAFVFPESGTDLRWRASLVTTRAPDRPRITRVAIRAAGGQLEAEMNGGPLRHNQPSSPLMAFVGHSTEAKVTLTNRGSAALHIDSITLEHAGREKPFSAHFNNGPIRTIASQSSVSFTLRYAADVASTSAATLVIASDSAGRIEWRTKLSGSGIEPNLQVSRFAYGRFSILDGHLEIGGWPFGWSVNDKVFITNFSALPVNITRIGATPPAGSMRRLTPPVTIAPKQDAVFHKAMGFKVTRPGTQTAIFRVYTDLSDSPHLEMNMRANGLAPDMDVWIDEHLVAAGGVHDLGEVIFGTTLTVPVRFLSDGNAWLRVDGISGSGGFGLHVGTDAADFPVVLPVGDSATASLHLRPLVSGTFTTTLIVAGNAYDGVSEADGRLSELDEAVVEAAGALAVRHGVSTYVFVPDVYADTTRAFTLRGFSRAPEVSLEVAGRVFREGAAAHDFGEVFVGTTQTVTVNIRNNGIGALVIHSVEQGPEGRAHYSFSPPGSRVIAAGSSTSLTVRFRPQAVASPLHGQLHIHTSDPERAAWLLNLTGAGVGPEILVGLSTGDGVTELDNREVYEMGDLAIGSTLSFNLLVRNRGTRVLGIDDIHIGGGDSGVEGHQVRMRPALSLHPGFFHSYSFNLPFRPARFRPLERGMRTVAVTIDSNAYSFPVHVIFLRVRAVGPEMAVRIGGSGFSPGSGSYDFGGVRRDTTETAMVQIGNIGERVLDIDSIGVTGAGFSLTGGAREIAPGTTGVWSLHFTPVGDGADYRGALTIGSNYLHVPDWRLGLSGAVGEPEMTVSVGGRGFESGAGIHDFGRVRTGTTEITAVTVANTGSARLGVTSVEAGGGAFGVTGNAPRFIAAGSSATWLLHFTPPDGATTHRTTLVIVNDDADESRWTLPLTGGGGEPDIHVEIGSPGFTTGARHYNFGNVTGGTTATVEVRVFNRGDARLNFESVALEGSSWMFLDGADIRQLAPASSATWVVRFVAPLMRILPQSTTLSIVSNDMDEGVWVSTLRADVALPSMEVSVGGVGIGAQPPGTGRHYSFDRVRQGSNSIMGLQVRNSGAADLHVESIAVTGTGFSLVDDHSRKIQPGLDDEWGLRFEPPPVPGTYHGVLTIVSDDPDHIGSGWRLSLDAVSVGPDIAVRVGGMDFGSGAGRYAVETTSTAAPVTAAVTVANDGNAHLHVQSIEVAGDNYRLLSTATRTLAAGSSGSWTLLFEPGADAVTYDGILTIVSDDADEGRWTLPLAGTVIGPEIAVEPDIARYDFGAVREGTTQTLEVRIYNEGNRNLENLDVGVTGAGYRLAGGDVRTLAAGASATWAVQFSPPDRAATHTGMLVIAGNDFDEPRREVRLQGTGFGPEIAVSAGGADYQSGAGVHHFGEVLAGTSASAAVTVTNAGNWPLDVGSIGVTGAGYSLAGTDTRTIAAGSSATWLVQFEPPALFGTYHGALTIASDDPYRGDWTLPLAGVSVGPDIAVRVDGAEFESGAGSYGLDGVALGAEASATVTITNAGTADLHIESVEVAGAGYGIAGAATRTLAAGASGSWTLVLRPRGRVAAYRGMLTITSDDVDEGRWTLALDSAVVGPVMVIAPDITSHDFGGVWEDTTQTLEVTVHNEGSRTLDAAARVDGAGYRLAGGGGRTVAAGSSAAWVVQFSPPHKITPAIGTLTITGNDYAMPARAVSLRGYGIGPEIAVRAGAAEYESGAGVYDFGGVEPATSETVTVRVYNEGNSDLNIESVEVEGAGYTLLGGGGSRALPMNSSAAWLVRLFAQDYGTTYHGTLTIASDDADEGEWTLDMVGVSGGPVIVIEAAEPGFQRSSGLYDFGGIAVRAETETRVTVGNHGNAVLVMDSVSVAGDDYDIAGEARTVDPGSTVTFTLYFSPDEAVKVSTGALTIVSDDPHSPVKTLDLSGYGIGPLMTPIMIIGGQFFGYGSSDDYDFIANIGVRERFRISLVLQNRGNAPLEVYDLSVSGAGFQLEADLPGLGLSRRRTILPGNGAIYTNGLIFQSDVRGTHTGRILVESNDVINPFPIRLQIHNVEPEIEVNVGGADVESGDVFDSGRVPVSEVVTAAVVVRNAATRNLNIRSIDATGTGFSLADTSVRSIAPGSSGTWMLRFAPPDSGTTPYTGTLTIVSDDYDEGVWNLSLRGTGIESEIEVVADGRVVESSATLNFGDIVEAMATTETVAADGATTATVRYRVVSGTVVAPQDGVFRRLSVVRGPTTKTVTVRNTGTYTLKVSAALLSGLGYSSDMPSSFEVAPGQETGFNFVVTPTGDRRAFFGRLVLATNDIDEKVWVLNMATYAHGIQVNVKVFLEGPYEYR